MTNSFGKCVIPADCEAAKECEFEGERTGVINDCSKYTECNNGKLITKSCTVDIELPLFFDALTQTCRPESEAQCYPILVCKSTLDLDSDMIGICKDIDKCTGAAIKGNCTATGHTCCVAENASELQNTVEDDSTKLTKEIFLKIAGDTVRNQAIYKYFVESMRLANVTSEYEIAAYLAQLIGETKYFRSIESIILEKDFDELIGNNVTGDGTKYRGRGGILLIGRTAYHLAQTNNGEY